VTGARLLAEARAAGVTVRLEGGKVRLSAAAAPPAELLARLRRHRAELLGLLRREGCQRCGTPVSWRGPGGITFADGTVMHVRCYEEAELARFRAGAR